MPGASTGAFESCVACWPHVPLGGRARPPFGRLQWFPAGRTALLIANFLLRLSSLNQRSSHQIPGPGVLPLYSSYPRHFFSVRQQRPVRSRCTSCPQVCATPARHWVGQVPRSWYTQPLPSRPFSLPSGHSVAQFCNPGTSGLAAIAVGTLEGSSLHSPRCRKLATRA